MGEDSSRQVTQLLIAWGQGDQEALNALTPLVYEELSRLARAYMRRERPDHTLQSTALVHEAYLRLVDQKAEWKSRAQFFGVAAQMMRRILLDHAKSRQAARHGGGARKIPLDDPALVSARPDVNLVALDEALTKLEKTDPQRGRIVELRYFGGLSNEEISDVLSVSTATVQRHWTGAKAWLYHEMSQGGEA